MRKGVPGQRHRPPGRAPSRSSRVVSSGPKVRYCALSTTPRAGSGRPTRTDRSGRWADRSPRPARRAIALRPAGWSAGGGRRLAGPGSRRSGRGRDLDRPPAPAAGHAPESSVACSSRPSRNPRVVRSRTSSAGWPGRAYESDRALATTSTPDASRAPCSSAATSLEGRRGVVRLDPGGDLDVGIRDVRVVQHAMQPGQRDGARVDRPGRQQGGGEQHDEPCGGHDRPVCAGPVQAHPPRSEERMHDAGSLSRMRCYAVHHTRGWFRWLRGGSRPRGRRRRAPGRRRRRAAR